ncbi:MAG: hypothetical protein WC297_03450 [Candidatus Paceibacterota bacterium]|jgi:hypothetical protein
MKLKINKRLLLIFSYLLVGFLVVVAVKAITFTGPTEDPSGGNPDWPKINSVVGSTDVNMDNNGYVVVGDDMTFTDTFAAGNILVEFNATLAPSGSNNESFRVQIEVDGVMKQRIFMYTRATDGVSPSSPTTLVWAGSVSAGSHTIRVMIDNGGRNNILSQGTVFPRVLTITRGFN